MADELSASIKRVGNTLCNLDFLPVRCELRWSTLANVFSEQNVTLKTYPPCFRTTARASRVAVCIATRPADSVVALDPLPSEVETSSLINGSTRVDRGMSKARAFIASIRTCLDGSESALTNVV